LTIIKEALWCDQVAGDRPGFRHAPSSRFSRVDGESMRMVSFMKGTHMKVITATTLRRELSEILDRVEQGETVEITRGGRPVARLSAAVVADWRDRVRVTPKTVGGDDSAFAPLPDVWSSVTR
jgi:prevent-host-death family protein